MTIQTFYLPERGGVRRGRVWQSAPWERFEGRGVIATAIALAALAASATAGGAIASGAIGAHAAGSAAATQAKATSDATAQQLQYEREALAAQTKANEESLAYTKQQAGQTRADAEVNREGDYEQWAAREGRLSTIGGMLGLPARQIPGYRPLGPEQGVQPPAGASSGAPAPALPGGNDPVSQAILDNYKALGVAPTGPGTGPTDIAYMTQQAKAALASGERPLSYWLGPNGRIAQELAKAGGGGAPAASGGSGAAPYGSIAAISARPYQPLTPAYVAPTIPAQGSIRQFSQMAA